MRLALSAIAVVGVFSALAVADDKLPRMKAAELKSVRGGVDANIVIKDKHGASKKGELDIADIGAYNDPQLLRIEINLKGPISFKTKAAYAFRIVGKDFEECYAYTVPTKKMYYLKYSKGVLKEKKELEQKNGSDDVDLGDVGKVKNQLVVLFIDKDKHFSKEDKGKPKFITIQAYSGTWEKDIDDTKPVDETDKVELVYNR